MTKIEYSSTVDICPITTEISNKFDYQFIGKTIFEGYDKPIVPSNFKIGLIVGPSGSGKSLLLKEFGNESQINWLTNSAIVSHFSSSDDAINRLIGVGLNSIPSWFKPYNILSNGEKFRANLARQLKSNIVIDEFTSVIDRNVAKSVCASIKKFVDNNNINQLVFASCHYDIIEWLRPCWIFNTLNGQLQDGRLLQRPKIKINIYTSNRKF